NMLMRAAEYELIPMCQEKNVGLLCYSPMAQGLLTGRFATADEVPAGRARTRHFSSTRPEARHGEPGCEEETFTAIAQFKAFCQARNLNMAHASLAWLLHQPTVTSVLAGASRPEQATANALAADITFTQTELDELDQITLPVKDQLGPSLDVWASEARTR
ncbi:MAG: aldo/keto reductase, partial [Phycisphaeraceae bacterium JB051]